MAVIKLIFHHEDGIWWVESPDMPGYTASSDTFNDVHKLAQEGISMFAKEQKMNEKYDVHESLDNGVPLLQSNTMSFVVPQQKEDRKQPFFVSTPQTGDILNRVCHDSQLIGA